MADLSQLPQHLGKSIDKFCPNGFTAASENHCAHFISHVQGYQFGLTCRTMGRANGNGGNIRVQELFARCPRVGTWASRPSNLTECLVFVTAASNVNVATKVMANVPRKHVGILWNGRVFHYKNAISQVVCVTPEEFNRHYPEAGVALFYGQFPQV